MTTDKQNQDFDIFYLVMGKMLFIASDFENELIALSNFLSIRLDPTLLSNPSELIKLFGGYTPAAQRVKDLGLPANLSLLLKEAVQSRNYIAHELALSVYNNEADQDSLDKFVEHEIKTHIEPILKASYEIKAFWAIRNNSTLTATWIDKQLNWIKRDVNEY